MACGAGERSSSHVAQDEYGKWEIVDAVDEGGQAHVFRAKDRTGDEPGLFALKRLRNGNEWPI